MKLLLIAATIIIITSFQQFTFACVDLNTASQEELETLPGIGASKAADLIAYRPYQTWDDVDAVPGIGPATIEDIKPFCCPLGDNPLPVVFQGLSARKTRNGIEITFSANSEKIAGFNLYKNNKPINQRLIKAKEGYENYRFVDETGQLADVYVIGAVELNGVIVKSASFKPVANKAITWAWVKSRR